MAKIDTSKIENYDSMSAEEKLAALEAYELPAPDYSGYVKKDLFDKTSSELAAAKKKIKDSQTEEEKKAEADRQKDEELETLRKQVKVSELKAKYAALGYDESTAEEAANAAYDGNFDKVFELQSKNIEAVKKSVKSEEMKKTPAPGSGEDQDKKKDRKKMTLAERQKLYSENPGEFSEMFG